MRRERVAASMNARHLALDALSLLRVPRLFARRFGGRGSLFMLHRVLPADAPRVARHLCVHAGFLQEILEHLTAEGWDLIGLDEVEQRLHGPPGPRFACFTFDDGYRDSREVALPILRAFGAPAAIYACPGFADGSADYWWGALAALIAGSDQLELAGVASLRTASETGKQAAFRRCARLWRSDPDRFRPALRDALEARGIDEAEVLRRDLMSWDELEQLARDPLVTIGAHGMSHRPLARLDAAAARAEMDGARARLSERIGVPVRHLAYPYGSPAECGRREFDLARELGFATAVTARHGNLFAEHAESLTALPRIPIGGYQRGVRDFELYGSGTVAALRHRFVRIVAG